MNAGLLGRGAGLSGCVPCCVGEGGGVVHVHRATLGGEPVLWSLAQPYLLPACLPAACPARWDEHTGLRPVTSCLCSSWSLPCQEEERVLQSELAAAQRRVHESLCDNINTQVRSRTCMCDCAAQPILMPVLGRRVRSHIVPLNWRERRGCREGGGGARARAPVADSPRPPAVPAARAAGRDGRAVRPGQGRQHLPCKAGGRRRG